jgi:hypothetical protein
MRFPVYLSGKASPQTHPEGTLRIRKKRGDTNDSKVQDRIEIVLSIFFCSPKRKWTKRKGRPAKMVPTTSFSLGVGNVPSPNAQRRFFKVPRAFPLPRKKSPHRVDDPTIGFAHADGTPFSKGGTDAKSFDSCLLLQNRSFKPPKSTAAWVGRLPPVRFDFGRLLKRLSTSKILHGRNHWLVWGCLNTRVSISASFLWFLSLDEQRKEQHPNLNNAEVSEKLIHCSTSTDQRT